MISEKRCLKPMGRQKYSTKIEAEQLTKIEMWWLRKNRFLESGWNFGKIESIEFQIVIKNSQLGIYNYDYIRFFLTQTYWNGESGSIACDVRLTNTPCHYGNLRYWFVCPCCQRRVGVLYLAGSSIACRHCHNLTYKSKRFGKKSKNYDFIQLMTVFPKMVELTENLRSRYYAGKPTRKFRKFIKHHNKNQRYINLWMRKINNNPQMFR